MNADTSQYWAVEYEIPPMRAIYNADYTKGQYMPDEESVRRLIAEHEPQWRIRKVTLKSTEASAS